MRQAEVARILDTKKIKYELIDVSLHESLLKEMRQKAGNPTAVPPQIFNRDDYCGDYQKMFEANENCEFLSFLKMGSADHEC
uniref:SH3 domain-binding glutamic acid-rich-like protein 3 n=1 Tax=Geotrypetes seraphini TaxID=260995 RepID=A0A6P8RF17_GEOSA|nr:SH3 domain-binding glutamic acid-rich-like protein 3 [Geotrypetes seraphini]